MQFADRIVAAQRKKDTIVVLGVDPQLDSRTAPGFPDGYTLSRFCCEIIEACAPFVVAIKPQLAFFEARGLDGMHAFVEVLKLARSLGLITIADAKRGDIGSTSAAYAEAFLGDGDFGCDAVTVHLYQGSDTITPFVAKVGNGRGVFVCVKTSNPSSGEFQDLPTPEGPHWESVAKRVHGFASDFIGTHDLSPIGAVVGATYPKEARRARQLMPNSIILVPGYGTQGATAADATAGVRLDDLGIIVNASRSLMYAFQNRPGMSPGAAAAEAAYAMRNDLNSALPGHARISSASSAARVA